MMLPEPVQHVVEAVEAVRARFRTLLAALAAGDPRPADLQSRLGLDKSLASRLIRGLRGEEAAAAALELPAPEGLRLVLAACAERGLAGADLPPTHTAIDLLDGAFARFPGGRRAALAALAPAGDRSARSARAERAARRAAFAAASDLHGLEVDTAYFGLLMGPTAPAAHPHADEPPSNRLDQAMLSATLGLRRLRPGPPLTLGGVHGSPLNEGPPQRTTLDGRPISLDPTVVLLPQFCAGIERDVRVERSGSAYRLWIDERSPPIDRPVHLVYGLRSVGFVERLVSERQRWACTTYVVSRPTRELVVDILVPEGAFGDDAPLLRWNLDPFPKLDPVAGPPRDGRDTLQTTVAARRVTAQDHASEPEPTRSILERGLELLGWDRARLVHHRLAMDFPPLLVGLQIWFPLAER